MYRVTYHGHHTCQMIDENTQLFSDYQDLSFRLLNFMDSKTIHLPNSPSTISNTHINPSIEQEVNSKAQSIGYGQSTVGLWNDVSENGSSVNDLTFDESLFCTFDF